jgi:2-hydroxychromene-2-carboxylate isomerase
LAVVEEKARDFAGGRNELGPLARQLTSRFIRLVVSPRRRAVVRAARELGRRITNSPHRIDYFHQVDDPYSHLAAQALGPLCRRYAVELVPHLVSPAEDANIPEPELLAALARRDCDVVARHYGLGFPGAPDSGDRSVDAVEPKPESIRSVERALAAVLRDPKADFAASAVALGRALWSGGEAALEALATDHPPADAQATQAALEEGAALRGKLGHYSGAMFLYGGEWYWGVDRLHHLERRLALLGATHERGELLFARPEIEMNRAERGAEMTLEVFPSLRSPYTSICFERVLELADRTGVELVVRPVLPMVMRNVPVPMVKGLYIMMDTQREAEFMGVPFGKMIDPIGNPVRRAYSLWPWAKQRGRGPALLAAFLRAAFMEGIDTSADAGLRAVVERAGLDWQEACQQLGDPAWEDEVEVNRVAMVDEMGQWGVPSFRLRGPGGAPELCCWGQDRLWLVAREIQARSRT